MIEKDSPRLFSIVQKDGRKQVFFCDFLEKLGEGEAGETYRGYYYNPPSSVHTKDLKAIDEKHLDKDKPVAIKVYQPGKKPSAYQLAHESIGLSAMGRQAVLIMDYIDGFHIYPELNENPALKALSFFQAVDLAWQLVIGLRPLHDWNSRGLPMVHGDPSGMNIKIKPRNHQGLDACYLDFDYTKPILPVAQRPQGTPEVIAPEVMQGLYSESSDFYALCPMLLSIFGAINPFYDIFEYRDNDPRASSLSVEFLIEQYINIGFNHLGLFDHFQEDIPVQIAELLEDFILRMGAKEKKDRPSADAILEFFTALRQWCLVKDEDALEEKFYRLRLLIAAEDSHMTATNSPRSCFFKPGSGKADLDHLIQCFKLQDAETFFSDENKACRERLQHCKNPEMASLIMAIQKDWKMTLPQDAETKPSC